MVNNDLTLLALLIDHSGSMSHGLEDMQGGINTLISEQAKVSGECEITLAEFDDHYDLIWPVQPIALAPDYTLTPRGMTALLDAVGKFITQVGKDLAQRDEDKRPGKVIVCIVTDGLENSSREWTRDKVKALIEQQRNDWNWEFLFLGANMDAVAEGGSIGVTRGASLTYNQGSSAAVGNVYAAASSNLASYRSGQSQNVSFSDQDRKMAMEEDGNN